jgi:hypothetical protein
MLIDDVTILAESIGKFAVVTRDEWMGLPYPDRMLQVPPKGRATALWAKRHAKLAALGVEVITALPASTDTAWFQYAAAPGPGRALCLVSGRCDVPKESGEVVPSACAILYAGPRTDEFRKVFRILGVVYGGS